MKILFEDSKSSYQKGKLQDAAGGFERIKKSGVKLNVNDRGGDLIDVDGYLKLIADEKGSPGSGEVSGIDKNDDDPGQTTNIAQPGQENEKTE